MDRGALAADAAGSPTRAGICLVVGQLGLGGIERQVYILASGLDPRRYDVTVVSLTLGGAWLDRLESAGVRVVQLARRGHFDWRRLLSLIRVFREIRPSIVYSWNYEANAYARLAGLAASVAILVTGEEAIYLSRSQAALERLLVRITDCVIPNAEAVRRDLLDRVGLPPWKTITIRNAVEIPPAATPAARQAARDSLGVERQDRVVGTIVRLEEVKNVPMLLRVAALCREADPSLRFCIIGGGSLEAPLREEIRDRRLEGIVRVLGGIQSAKDLLPGFDIFVLTSRSEGLPNVVLEAMAAGLPCVCTAVGGCLELIEPGVSGYLVPSDDSAAMAGHVLRLAADPDERARLGASARRKTEREFSVAEFISRNGAVFENLLAGRERRARGRRLLPETVRVAE